MFNLVAMTAFWITLVLLALYLFHVIEKLHNVNWILTVSILMLWDGLLLHACMTAVL